MVVENEIPKASSNSRWGCLCLTLHYLEKGRDSFLPPFQISLVCLVPATKSWKMKTFNSNQFYSTYEIILCHLLLMVEGFQPHTHTHTLMFFWRGLFYLICSAKRLFYNRFLLIIIPMKKWTRREEFKSLIRLFAFLFEVMLSGEKV